MPGRRPGGALSNENVSPLRVKESVSGQIRQARKLEVGDPQAVVCEGGQPRVGGVVNRHEVVLESEALEARGDDQVIPEAALGAQVAEHREAGDGLQAQVAR